MGNPVDVFIVDDHDLLAQSLALSLEMEGIRVARARGDTAEDTLRIARDARPTVVLLDLDLGPPLGNGRDLIAPLRELGARVVMLTGVTDPVRLAECVEAGADGLAGKTQSFDAVLEVVRRALGGEELMPADERQARLAELGSARREVADRMAPFAGLTDREGAVLGLMMAGRKAETMAAELYVSLPTVRSHIRAVLQKLGVSNQLAAVVLAERAGWLPPA